jgi:PKD repeat protein
MLNQPDILGQVTSDQKPVAAISDIGLAVTGQSITLDARASFDPDGNALRYAWDFGDGSRASGISVAHAYKTTGNYPLKLTVSSSQTSRTVVKLINIVRKPTSYDNPYARDQQDGFPPPNPSVIYPRANNSLSDQVLTVAAAATVTARTSTTSPSTPGISNPTIGWIIGALALASIFIAGIVVVLQRRKARV